MRKFGLIGEHLPHSFSGKYFAGKFRREGIEGCEYSLYELAAIDELEQLLSSTPELEGFNVTIPYKQQVIKFLSSLSPEAEAVGAVNCVKREADGALVGYNTDVVGLRSSLLDLLSGERPTRALILGTGGAALAAEYILRELDIEYKLVSRQGGEWRLNYSEVTPDVISDNKLIINATPLGTYPNTSTAPEIPYEALTSNHYLFDLVYNPPLTKFLESGQKQGAKVKNGSEMLIGQAEAAWMIWNQ
ncbi:MAG: shikimate dehydrogenase [Rikenellaceae bacterium]